MPKTLTERFYNQEELTVKQRKKIGAGDIRINRIRCRLCRDIITSIHRHDFKMCKCRKVGVDGGSWYRKRLGEECNWEEMSQYYKKV